MMLQILLHGCGQNQQTFLQTHTDMLFVALACMNEHCQPQIMLMIQQQTFQNNQNMDVSAST